MQPYKEDLKQAYNRSADALESKFDDNFSLVRDHAERFRDALRGKTVLDVGSGAGTHAAFFNQLGLDVTCVDISEEMLKKCESKGLKTLLVDLEELHFPDKTIDGIWSYAALIHIRKENIPRVVKNFARMLKPKGILGLAVKEGNKDGFESIELLPGVRRWFTFFVDYEVRNFFSPYFDIIYFQRETAKGSTYLRYILRKR